MRRSVKAGMVALVALLVAIGGSASAGQGTAAIEIGDKAPAFLLPSTWGEKMGPGQFAGKKLVLVFFYTQDFNPT